MGVAAFMAVAGLANAQSRSVDPEVYEKLDVFAHVLEKIRTSYVEQVTETGVIENAINGMLTSLDPHSGYLKKDEMKELKQQTQGKFGGLGIEVTMENGLVKVVSPIEDTPAAQAGLETNDFIIRIDAKDVQGMTLKDAVDNMRGAPGSKVKLLILRESEKRTFPVVLMNGGSASAAEIVGGALQDNRRAVVLGTKSFGKGSVQTIFDLPGATGMRLTTALYYTPSGKSIQAHGIVPDILQKPLKTKEQERLALEDDDLPSEASLLGHLSAGKAADVSKTEPRADLPQTIYANVPEKSPSDTLAGMDGKPDAQLDRAVSVMKALVVWPQTKGAAAKAPAATPAAAR